MTDPFAGSTANIVCALDKLRPAVTELIAGVDEWTLCLKYEIARRGGRINALLRSVDFVSVIEFVGGSIAGPSNPSEGRRPTPCAQATIAGLRPQSNLASCPSSIEACMRR